MQGSAHHIYIYFLEDKIDRKEGMFEYTRVLTLFSIFLPALEQSRRIFLDACMLPHHQI